ncbi:MAG: 16S rRNA (uracil(1498)-N(3))-methyltransferase [Bacteroidia bacterium]|nr:16S rRNA (uracil(1498)-N(3))-methyltransferase [Bacteroidia bacterium]
MNLFFAREFTSTNSARVSGQEHLHLSRVLRLREGDPILINDLKGAVYDAVIHSIEKEATICTLREKLRHFNEPPIPVTLALAVMKNPGKMDWVVEKGTELGMTAFQPLLTKRTVPSSVKIARLRTLAETAVKQCLRAVVPEIHEALILEQTLHAAAEHRLLVCHEAADLSCTPENLSFDDKPITLFIGPEGGFADEEVALFRDRGAEILSLGPRRLRGETAAIAALARVIARLEHQNPSRDNQVSDITNAEERSRR